MPVQVAFRYGGGLSSCGVGRFFEPQKKRRIQMLLQEQKQQIQKLVEKQNRQRQTDMDLLLQMARGVVKMQATKVQKKIRQRVRRVCFDESVSMCTCDSYDRTSVRNITEMTAEEKKMIISGKIRDTPLMNWPMEHRVRYLRRFMIKSEHGLALAMCKAFTYGEMQQSLQGAAPATAAPATDTTTHAEVADTDSEAASF
jgi:hypothetical protein